MQAYTEGIRNEFICEPFGFYIVLSLALKHEQTTGHFVVSLICWSPGDFHRVFFLRNWLDCWATWVLSLWSRRSKHYPRDKWLIVRGARHQKTTLGKAPTWSLCAAEHANRSWIAGYFTAQSKSGLECINLQVAKSARMPTGLVIKLFMKLALKDMQVTAVTDSQPPPVHKHV